MITPTLTFIAGHGPGLLLAEGELPDGWGDTISYTVWLDPSDQTVLFAHYSDPPVDKVRAALQACAYWPDHTYLQSTELQVDDSLLCRHLVLD
jgi:hypothetical protein